MIPTEPPGSGEASLALSLWFSLAEPLSTSPNQVLLVIHGVNDNGISYAHLWLIVFFCLFYSGHICPSVFQPR
ncbi:hypothetical protein BS47DRAFT_1335588 [Hydnum rufescens UP504]|uniref:Uncharacterized protein n=1 Tax=Hydnum rufescens UP504 TaxID=1448309 RepID=A0A9P6BAR2_9AGAM|nr:hypothetical protein BS47DRAFT_1335588 [Hydnum rufescens UP504]